MKNAPFQPEILQGLSVSDPRILLQSRPARCVTKLSPLSGCAFSIRLPVSRQVSSRSSRATTRRLPADRGMKTTFNETPLHYEVGVA